MPFNQKHDRRAARERILAVAGAGISYGMTRAELGRAANVPGTILYDLVDEMVLDDALAVSTDRKLYWRLGPCPRR